MPGTPNNRKEIVVPQPTIKDQGFQEPKVMVDACGHIVGGLPGTAFSLNFTLW
jgi:hypothetical protein